MVYEKRHAIAGHAADPNFMVDDIVTASQSWNLCHDADAKERASLANTDFLDDLYSLHCEGSQADAGQNFEDNLNFPLLVLRYLLRRLHLASRFCLVCHRETRRGNI